MSEAKRDLTLVEDATILVPHDRYSREILSLRRSLRGPILIGLGLISIFVVGFGLWATTVPLAGGAIAPGVISPDGSTRTVQHLEGGIVRKLYVRDGDIVEKEQALVVLQDVQSLANHDLNVKQHRMLRTTRARLIAERDGEDAVTFPADLLELGPDTQALIAGQRELFAVRRASHNARNRVLRQRIGQLGEQIKGYEAQVESAARQLELIASEVSAKEALATKGYLTRPELLRLQRLEAELVGRRGQYEAAISEARQRIGEAELQLVANETERADKIATQLDQVSAEINSLDEKLRTSADILERTTITAPVSGKVVNLRFKTEGGVIQPGTPILDIVPTDEKLMIEARVSPMDIDIVREGLQAQIQLSALSNRSTPRLAGIVRTVSADRVVDETSKQSYYLARVEIGTNELSKVGMEGPFVAGMPAEVLIVTGQRTLADYLLKPFFEAVWRTMREA